MVDQQELSEALSNLRREEVEYAEGCEKYNALEERCKEISDQVTHLEGRLEAAASVRNQIIQTLLFDATAQLALDRHNDEHIRRERELNDLIDLKAVAALASKEAAEHYNAAYRRARHCEELHKELIFKARAAEVTTTCREALEELALAALDTAGRDLFIARERIMEMMFPYSVFSFDDERRSVVICRMRGEATDPSASLA